MKLKSVLICWFLEKYVCVDIECYSNKYLKAKIKYICRYVKETSNIDLESETMIFKNEAYNHIDCMEIKEPEENNNNILYSTENDAILNMIDLYFDFLDEMYEILYKNKAVKKLMFYAKFKMVYTEYNNSDDKSDNSIRDDFTDDNFFNKYYSFRKKYTMNSFKNIFQTRNKFPNEFELAWRLFVNDKTNINFMFLNILNEFREYIINLKYCLAKEFINYIEFDPKEVKILEKFANYFSNIINNSKFTDDNITDDNITESFIGDDNVEIFLYKVYNTYEYTINYPNNRGKVEKELFTKKNSYEKISIDLAKNYLNLIKRIGSDRNLNTFDKKLDKLIYNFRESLLLFLKVSNSFTLRTVYFLPGNFCEECFEKLNNLSLYIMVDFILNGINLYDYSSSNETIDPKNAYPINYLNYLKNKIETWIFDIEKLFIRFNFFITLFEDYFENFLQTKEINTKKYYVGRGLSVPGIYFDKFTSLYSLYHYVFYQDLINDKRVDNNIDDKKNNNIDKSKKLDIFIEKHIKYQKNRLKVTNKAFLSVYYIIQTNNLYSLIDTILLCFEKKKRSIEHVNESFDYIIEILRQNNEFSYNWCYDAMKIKEEYINKIRELILRLINDNNCLEMGYELYLGVIVNFLYFIIKSFPKKQRSSLFNLLNELNITKNFMETADKNPINYNLPKIDICSRPKIKFNISTLAILFFYIFAPLFFRL